MVNEVMKFLLQHVHSQCPLPISANHSSEHLDKIFIVNSNAEAIHFQSKILVFAYVLKPQGFESFTTNESHTTQR